MSSKGAPLCSAPLLPRGGRKVNIIGAGDGGGGGGGVGLVGRSVD